MKVTEDVVHYVAELASLELSEPEVSQYTQELSKILNFVEQLNQLELAEVAEEDAVMAAERVSVSPLQKATQMADFRADAVSHPVPLEALLANGPEIEDGFFQVPRIL